MAVGAGSIARAVKAQEAERKKAAEKKEREEYKEMVEEKEPEKESVSIHEEKFKVVSHIKSDLPIYLL